MLIRTKNLTKRFGSTFALKGVDLQIKKGEIFGIIGMSGAGKSTLVRCLTGLEKPTEGEIFLGESEMTSLSEKEWRIARKKFGMIFQHFNLFSSRTTLDNVAYPLEIAGVPAAERRQRASALLAEMGLKAKQRAYPAELSGGEKQRVAIARALANHPDFLLCDEATSALDPRTTRSILELLDHLNRQLGLTILLITHEMEAIKQICTEVAVLEHGEIVEQGRTLDLFSTPQHPTTKRFLQRVTHEVPTHLLPKEGEVVRLSFTGESAGKAIISHLIRTYGIEVNILLGSIDILKNGTVGHLVIALSGSTEERLLACRYLEEAGVIWERLHESC